MSATFVVIGDRRYPPPLTASELEAAEHVARVILENQAAMGGPGDQDVKTAFVLLRMIGMVKHAQQAHDEHCALLDAGADCEHGRMMP